MYFDFSKVTSKKLKKIMCILQKRTHLQVFFFEKVIDTELELFIHLESQFVQHDVYNLVILLNTNYHFS